MFVRLLLNGQNQNQQSQSWGGGWVGRELLRQCSVCEVVTQIWGCDMGEDKGIGAEVTKSSRLLCKEPTTWAYIP